MADKEYKYPVKPYCTYNELVDSFDDFSSNLKFDKIEEDSNTLEKIKLPSRRMAIPFCSKYFFNKMCEEVKKHDLVHKDIIVASIKSWYKYYVYAYLVCWTLFAIDLVLAVIFGPLSTINTGFGITFLVCILVFSLFFIIGFLSTISMHFTFSSRLQNQKTICFLNQIQEIVTWYLVMFNYYSYIDKVGIRVDKYGIITLKLNNGKEGKFKTIEDLMTNFININNKLIKAKEDTILFKEPEDCFKYKNVYNLFENKYGNESSAYEYNRGFNGVMVNPYKMSNREIFKYIDSDYEIPDIDPIEGGSKSTAGILTALLD